MCVMHLTNVVICVHQSLMNDPSVRMDLFCEHVCQLLCCVDVLDLNHWM